MKSISRKQFGCMRVQKQPAFTSLSAKSVNLRGKTQVMTDIDDTVKSSGGLKVGGVYLGGVDTQYRRGDFYPGVFQFQLELATRSQSVSDPLKVAVLTARAKEFKWAIALKPTDKVVRAFENCGLREGYEEWGIGPVLYGGVREWLLQHLKGIRKFDNFKILQNEQSTYPFPIQYVFVGDTGEMDQFAGEKMLQSFPDKMQALFLHVVSESYYLIEMPEDKFINGIPVLFFRTYVGAATKAYKNGLISRAGLQRVVAQAAEDLYQASIPQKSSKWSDVQNDIKLAEKELRFKLLYSV